MNKNNKYNNLKRQTNEKGSTQIWALTHSPVCYGSGKTAQTYQNKEASVSWPFNDANYAT